LTLIAERTLLWRVTERDILLARIEVLQKKADAHFEKYLSLLKKMPDHGAKIKDTIAFYTALAAREEELEKYDKCQKNIDKLFKEIDQLREQ